MKQAIIVALIPTRCFLFSQEKMKFLHYLPSPCSGLTEPSLRQSRRAIRVGMPEHSDAL